MTEKNQIIRELGESDLLVPTLVNAAFASNERVKYCFTLLQNARSHADQPDVEHSNLRKERELAGVDNPLLDTVTEGTRKTGDDQYHIPLLGEILSIIRGGMTEMMAPFADAGEAPSVLFQERLSRLLHDLPSGDGEVIRGSFIDAMSRGDREGNDSLHLLVMDLHKALNQLQARLCTETIDGAKTYMLTDEDRPRVRAFMAGVNRTSPLRFGHPGLGTTATRSGSKLLIQNDIGLTDAHVLVVTIEGMTVHVTYTDIHIQRLQFFQSLFESYPVNWSDTLSRSPGKRMEKQLYHLTVGTYSADNRDDLDSFLNFLGSRIVFLIDWNRARKRLRNFIPNNEAIALLRWAAEHDVGHRGFLELGGERLIYDALEMTSGIPLRYGEPLSQILGPEKTIQFLRFVFQTSSRGLLSGTSIFLLKDEIRAELLQHFRSAQQGVMELCVEHISYAIEIGSVLQESLITIQQRGDMQRVLKNAQRAKRWEREADDLVNRVRTLSTRIEDIGYYADLIFISDDVADYLEEATFYTTLVPESLDVSPIHEELSKLSHFALKGCRGFLRALIAAQDFHRTNLREDLQEFLKSVDEVYNLERLADEALRHTERVIYERSTNFKEFRLYLEIASNIEEATNSLMKAAMTIRDRTLERMNR
ncbi:MAG: hypothetical protein NQU46_05245 [Methanolinea sp.]|nr:hypothetical protein [Methanolinea sp.]